ncbi:MAG: hypothetical protein JO190_12310 [Candidatus Eremiobacteraeota bacterium]|nr:hypothetical protein [Candidatus Eremiobacteraeota bacterium]MBV8498586.1 hypothetical protein [Candidatus Eremiobacteraeota bacterium]
MAIRIPAAPARSIAALRAALPSVATRAALARVAPRLAASLTAGKAASMAPALSYQVYTLGLSDLAAANGNDLKAAAKPSLWRHVLVSDGEAITADTSIDRTGAHHRFAALNLNPAAAAVPSTIEALEQDRKIADASYEASLLQIPALGVRAVWLHDPTAVSPDILVPVPPVRSDLVAERRYSVAEFVGALKHAALKILADDDPRKGAT